MVSSREHTTRRICLQSIFQLGYACKNTVKYFKLQRQCSVVSHTWDFCWSKCIESWKLRSELRDAVQCGISGTDISNKKSLQSCLLFLWRNTGNGWPWIWISRPSTGRRHHHLLFVQPTLKKKKRKRNKETKKHPWGGIKLMYVCHGRAACASSFAYWL